MPFIDLSQGLGVSVFFFSDSDCDPGNEGRGIRPSVLKCCTDYVQIKPSFMQSEFHKGGWSGDNVVVDSLNVSVATGIMLHHLTLKAGAS